MFFSIIIPVYNSEKTIARLFESIIKQKFIDYEIIIINDGSTDSSENIILEYKNKFYRFQYIVTKNNGVSVARNEGLKKAMGRYILFADADDYFEPNAFLKIYNHIQTNNSNLLCFNYYNVSLNNEKTDGLNLNNNRIELFPEKAITNFLSYIYINMFTGAVWNKVYKTDVIRNNCIKFCSNLHIGEDLLFNIEYFSSVNRLDILDEKIYNYVQTENSIMRSYREKNVEYIKNYIPELIKIFKKYNYESYYTIIFQFYISNLFGVISNEILQKNYQKGAKNIKSFCKYALDKDLFCRSKLRKIKLKYKIYYLLIISGLWRLIYLFLYLKNRIS